MLRDVLPRGGRFGRERAGHLDEIEVPLVALGQAIWHALQGRLFDYYGFNLVPFSAAVLSIGIVLTVWGWRRRVLSPALLAYATALLVVALARDTTEASPRNLFVAFPLFGLAAAWLDRRPPLSTAVVAVCSMVTMFAYVAFVEQLLWATT